MFGLSQAARLFGKAPPKFHTLEYGAQAVEEPQMEVPKELQDGPAGLEASHVQGAVALDESGQGATGWRATEWQTRQPEIQAGQEVSQGLEGLG